MNTGTWLVTEDLPNQWICYEFDGVRVKLNHYCVVSHVNCPHLRSWVVEVSATGRHWIEVDREEDHVIEGRNGVRSFVLKREEKCRFVRIRQIGRSNVSDNRLLINEFDVFGELIGPDHCTFAATGAKGVEQHAWHCKTCEIVVAYAATRVRRRVTKAMSLLTKDIRRVIAIAAPVATVDVAWCTKHGANPHHSGGRHKCESPF